MYQWLLRVWGIWGVDRCVAAVEADLRRRQALLEDLERHCDALRPHRRAAA